MNLHTRSHTAWLWLLLVALLVLPLFWLTPPAAGQKGEAKTDFENFDIRARESGGAKVALARALDKFPGKQLDQNVVLKAALDDGARRAVQAQPRLQVSYSQLTNTPEIAQARGGGQTWLSPPQKQPRENIVRQFLAQNSVLYGLNTAQLGKLQLVADYANPAGNLGWVRLEQRWNNLPVFQGELLGALTRDGELVRVVSGLTPGPGESLLPTTPKVSATQAVINAAASLKLTLTPNDLSIKNSAPDGSWVIFAAPQQFAQDIKVELKYFPLDAGLAVLSWSMILWQDNPAYYTLVSAEDGELLWRKNLTNDQTQPATYSVYSSDSPAPLSPTNALPGSAIQGAAIPRTSFTLISELPAFDNLGWMNDGDNTTTGNNVDAGLDLVAPDGIDPGGRPTGSPARVFDFLYNPAPGIPPPGDAPTLADYRNGEVVNMFFWTNRYHDRLYELGFTEAARNFQNDNFGRGGLGNDRVLAQGQDFSSTNNANFLTPPDGTSGRMQMFIFTGPTPDRSSGLDQEVLLHELTHGTSNRLHSNATGLGATMSGGMGEGWSDFYALSLLSQPGDDPNGVYAMGGYSTFQILGGFTDNYYYGIRRFPHAVRSTVGPNTMPHNPLTFADIDPSQINLTDGAFPRGPIGSTDAFQVHNIGEVWCSALWEVRARLINRLGYATGNQRMLQLVTDGMKLDPVNPTFLDGRNSILAADCAGFSGGDELDIWAGFATRGMGFSASAVSSSSSSVVEAFDIPNLNLGAVTITADTCNGGDGFADPGETLTLNIPLSNPFCATPANTVTVALNGGTPVNYGTIAAGATTAMGISFSIPNNPALCGTILPIMVTINSSLGPVTRTYNLQIGRPTGALPASFSTGNLSVPIPDTNTVEIPLNVTGLAGTTVADVNVRVRLNHSFDGDLVISLVHPDGTTVALSNNRGGAGDNFGSGANDCSGTHTVFDDAAATAIGAGIAPFAGTFRPDALLAGFNGKPTSGIWKLRVTDTATLDTGTVGCFQLEIAQQLYACCGVPGTPNVFAAPPATLTAESCAGANGAPDPLETVTVNFPLRNLGTGPTTNLVATLLPGGGVNLPSGPQNYGVVVAGGAAVARPFTFAVTGACGGTLTATLQLQDGATNLGTVTFTITLGGVSISNTSFSNPAMLTIPGVGTGTTTGAPANPYPSTINVAGLIGTVTKVTATLTGLSHTFPGDVDVLLVGPGGQRLLLMSDVVGGTDAVNANLTFDDAAASTLPSTGALVSGTFRPTNYGTGDLFPVPAPTGPYPDPQQLAVFNGTNPNGTWSLYVVDDAGTDVGSISGGWSLTITTSQPVCCTSPCTLAPLPNITVLLNANVVNYPLPTVVSGSCGVPVCVPPSGTAFPLGVTTVTCTAQNGGATSFTVTVACPTLTLTPSLANGVQGTAYNQTVALVADSSYTFAVTTNILPPGLTLNSATGAITGTPTAAGNFTFMITATGLAGCTKSQSYNLLITGTCVTITLNPSTLPNGTVGTTYPATTVSATGGVAPYSFTVSQGTLPAGLTLNASTGEIAGTPTQSGVFSFRLTATGQGGCTGSRNYVVSVGCAALTFNPATLPNPVKGVPYNQTINLSPFSNYTVSLLLGQLPPGLALSSNPSNSTATISGTTTLTGPYSFTLKAQAGSCQGTKAYSFTVGNMPALALRADYDGDGLSDLAVAGANGEWKITRSSDNQTLAAQWGTAGDVPLSGDYDGDGKTDLAIFRPSNGTWYVRRSSDGGYLMKTWGIATDLPVPGDYDGDGKTDLAIWRGVEGNWYIWHSNDQQYEVVPWGASVAPYYDVPVAGDYDGDGRTDIAVFRRASGVWYARLSSASEPVVKALGAAGDVPVLNDYDGDSKTDIAVWRGSTGVWQIVLSSSGAMHTQTWGTSAAPYYDVPVTGDYDGDGKADYAVWRPGDGTWYVMQSATGSHLMRSQGRSGDVPVPTYRVK